MFRWFCKNSSDAPAGLTKIRADFIEMLNTALHEYSVACRVAFREVPAESVKEDLLATDKKVNKAERNIRKELVVHCSVVGAIDPESLVMMSIAKDAERLGDYAKNIFDIGALDLVPPQGDDRERLVVLRTLIERIFQDCITIFTQSDEELAKKRIREATWISRQCESNTVRLLQLENPNRRTAADVLMYRFMKRIVLHLRNICSSVVQPVHKLDFTSKLTRDVDSSGDLLDPPYEE